MGRPEGKGKGMDKHGAGKGNKGAGKGAGKKIAEEFQGYCGHCNKWGHERAQCWSRQQNVSALGHEDIEVDAAAGEFSFVLCEDSDSVAGGGTYCSPAGASSSPFAAPVPDAW